MKKSKHGTRGYTCKKTQVFCANTDATISQVVSAYNAPMCQQSNVPENSTPENDTEDDTSGEESEDNTARTEWEVAF